MSEIEDVFRILCIQKPTIWPKIGGTEAQYKKDREENLNSCIRMMDRAIPESRFYPPVYSKMIRLVVLPEGCISGYPSGQDAEEWSTKGCMYIPGEETDKLGEKTQEYGIYIACNSYERVDDWPNAYFNTSFIIDPNGKVLTRFRRIHTGVCISPDEIYTEYKKKYGWEGMFPVADTKIGTIAALACGEIMQPEVCRMFALRGAEIICHLDGSGNVDSTLNSSSDPKLLAWSFCRRARAVENACYVASANGPRGCSEILDYYGRTLARTLDPGEQVISSVISINALRKTRKNELPHQIRRLRTKIFAEGYSKYTTFPTDWFKDGIPKNVPVAKGEAMKIARENCVKLGIIKE